MKLPPLIKNGVKAKTYKNRFFLKILLVTTACIILVVLLLSFSMYFSFKKMSIERTERDSISSFKQIEQTTSQMTQIVKSMALQVMMDEDCSSMLTATNMDTLDAFTNIRIVNRLRFYCDVNSYINSIYLYNKSLNIIYSSKSNVKQTVNDEFADYDIIEIMNNFGDYEFLSPIRRNATYEKGTEKISDEVLTYVVNETGKKSELDNAVVVNMSLSWLYDILDRMFDTDESAILALTQSGQVVVDFKNDCNFDWNGEGAASFLDNFKKNDIVSQAIVQNGVKYYATCFKSADNGWRYVKISKWDNVFDSLSKIKETTYIILGVILLIAILISVFIAGSFFKTYSAVEKRYNRLVNLRGGNDDYVIRSSFIFEILTGRKHIGQKDIESKFEKYSIPFSPIDNIITMMLKIERYSEFEQQLGSDYTNDMKYGLKNIFEEVAQQHFECVSIIESGDTITILARPKEEGWKELLQKTYENFCVNVKCFVDWEFILLYADQEVVFEELRWVYHELKGHVKDTFFYPANSCLRLETISDEHCAPLVYPALLEQRIVKALRANELGTAKELYLHLIDEIIDCQYDDFVTALILLCFAVTRLFSEYDSNDSSGKFDNYTDLISLIYGSNKLFEVNNIFYEIFDGINETTRLANGKSSGSDRTDEIQNYICDKYQNPDLSLETLAEHFSLSTSYIGKTFKRTYGTSVTEFINEVRVKKIAELLENTNESAKDIAIRCGFYNVNYFYTYFKKYFGLTPQSYRKKYKQDSVQ